MQKVQHCWLPRRTMYLNNVVFLVTATVTLLCPGSTTALPREKLIDQIAMESHDISSTQQQVASVLPPSHSVKYSGFKVNPNCKCGNAAHLSKDDNQHPWTAAIFYNYKEASEDTSATSPKNMILFCSGALVNDRYVLTASRCVQGLNATDLEVWLSEKQVWSDQKPEEQDHLQKLPVEEIILHPEFDPATLNHEVALLKMATPVKLSSALTPSSSSMRGMRKETKYFTPVCLPKYDMISKNVGDDKAYSKLSGSVVSWDKKGRTSYSLVQTKVPLVNGVEKCVEMMSNKTVVINENMLCAGNMSHGVKESCSMDTGSPLVVLENKKSGGVNEKEDTKGHYTLLGISSWLYGCTNLENVSLLYDVIFPRNTAKPQVPGVYARVERYRDWITHNTLDAVWCA